MYLPRSFRVTDPDEIRAFVHRHGFATLVTQSDAGPLVSHVPLMLDAEAGPHGTLRGHMARANDHWRAFAPDAAPSLAIFHGPHAYISPAWDALPIVPTWNYAVVHATGRPAVIDDETRVTELLDRLVTRYESERDAPWSLALSAEMRATLHAAIVAFEIPVDRVEAKYKLSQNRAPEDQRGALAGLAAEGGAAELVALWRDTMERHPPESRPPGPRSGLAWGPRPPKRQVGPPAARGVSPMAEAEALSSAYPAPKQRVEVHGLEMAYVEIGTGDPIVFLHGNPTSSYLWRNIMPHLADRGRCVAPDLIGMGDSQKLPEPEVYAYTYAQHRHYLDGFLDAVVPDGAVTLVIHDWGSALGFDWARRHPERVRGIAYMEAVVAPLEWSDFPEGFEELFRGFRSAAGETMVLEQNVFIEQVLPSAIQRKLSDEEMGVYRAPYTEPGESRRPTLTWPRQIPLAGQPRDVVESVAANAEFMQGATFPKLFVNAEPGALGTGRLREFCRTWPNQSEVTVSGIHFLQEDCPHEIGRAIREWLEGVG